MKNLLVLIALFASSTIYAQQADTLLKTTEVADTVLQKVEVEAYFPGGDEAWNKYIIKKIEANIDKLVKRKSYGTCEVQFIVDTDGSVSNVEALTLKNSLLAKVLVSAVKDGPKWVPAIMKGKPVKAWRRQKLTFRPPEE